MNNESEMEDPTKFQPGSFGCHEALHLASVFADMVDTHLVSHFAVDANPEWKALAEQAHEKLFELYQAIGAEHMLADPPDR